jgi:Fe-S-cluster-containing hydrogenase component 2
MFFADEDLLIEFFQSSQYIVDVARYIGCGFCAAVCTFSIWEIVENTPAE